MVYVMIAVITCFLLYIISNYVRSKNETAFWKDYIEIVEMKMRKMEKQV